MIHRRAVCWGLVITLLLAAMLIGAAAPVAAQAEVDAAHDYTFGQRAIFTLTLGAEAEVNTATLYLRINQAQTETYEAPIQEGEGSYERDLTQARFPAFAEITYWWEYEDAQGQRHKLQETTFLYQDNRYRWQTLENGKIVVHWVAGDANLMVTALDIAQSARAEIQNALRTSSDDIVQLYIYPSQSDLQSALRLTGYEWLGGVAYSDIGVILLNIPPTDGAVVKMRRDIPHELTHKALYDLVGQMSYDPQPIWLREGLASYFEQSPDPSYALALEEARQANRLIPMSELCRAFPTARDDIILAYAQSQSFIQYLQRTYGWARIRMLIAAYANGVDCSVGAREALGSDLATLEREWRVWLEQKGEPAQTPQQRWASVTVLLRDIAPWILLTALIGLPGVLFIITSHFGK
ncbi:MAG: peptidase MA family metallohydrolase [Anaerolineales bacterium]